MTKNIKLNKKIYFSYANTCLGLVNFSESIFNSQKFDKIYIVKGVFTQNFISKISKKYMCEYFINPINPEKTDGIIVEKTAVIDGSLFSFRDDSLFPAFFINLGEFCDEARLNQSREKIFEISEKRREFYNYSQKFLKSANELVEYLLDLSLRYLDEKKLTSAADRIISKCASANNSIKDEYRFINSTGSSELDTFENDARKIFYVSNGKNDNFTGFHFMRYISEKLKGSRIICPDALNPKRIRAVYLKDDNILFALQEKSEKNYDEKYNYINMERFVGEDFKKDHKQKLKFIKKLYDSLMAEAADCFGNIKNSDAELEKIYALAANSEAQQNFTADFIKKF